MGNGARRNVRMRCKGDGLPFWSRARAMNVVQCRMDEDGDGGDVARAIKKEVSPVQTPFFFLFFFLFLFLFLQFIHTSSCLPFLCSFFFFFVVDSHSLQQSTLVRIIFTYTLPFRYQSIPSTLDSFSCHTLIVITFPFRPSHSNCFLSITF